MTPSSIAWWPPARPRVLAVSGAALLTVAAVLWTRPGPGREALVEVTRGELVATITTTGTLRPIQSVTYRSPVPGRELEIREMAPEGRRVEAGEVLVRLGTTDLEVDLDRARQESRQAQLDLQVAEAEWEEAAATVRDVSDGEGALAVEEARSSLQRMEKRAERLREEYAHLKPLLDKGFITRDELARTRDELDEAEDELALARKRTDVVVQLAYPREQKRASLQLAQRAAQVALTRTRVSEAADRVALLDRLIEACTIRARGPGLVVYEELLNSSPRRKLRAGDRVFATQGIVTIPEVNRMRVETSVGEAELHRVRPGQTATIRVEAFPSLRLTGRVGRVGTLAGSSATRPFDEKRFDLVVDLDATTADLRPEMTARADIEVGAKTNVLLVPVTAVFEHRGSFVAFVAGRGGLETRPIELGESNDVMVEVTRGLEEHERVSTVAPPDAAGRESAPPNGQPR